MAQAYPNSPRPYSLGSMRPKVKLQDYCSQNLIPFLWHPDSLVFEMDCKIVRSRPKHPASHYLGLEVV